MQIKTETLEKLHIINFFPEQLLQPDNLLGVVADKTSTPHNLLGNILSLAGVSRVLAVPNLISVRYDTDNLAELKMLIMAEIDDFWAAPHPLSADFCNLPEKECAEALADAFIRPTLNRDGGDIAIHNVENGRIEISFTGHCAGCPYAQNTLQNVIMRTFLRYMPNIKEVKQKREE
jgi:Fe-S cluster biogenesis protein NfuA